MHSLLEAGASVEMLQRLDRMSNAVIYDLTQNALLVENVGTHHLRFLGDVNGMPEDEPCKEYALYIPPHGKRKPRKAMNPVP